MEKLTKPLDPATRDRIETFATHILASPHNLLSKRARGELYERHIEESVRFTERLPRGPARLLDIGSGGGLPGLIIAAVRDDFDVTLLEATRKKASFLRDTAAAMGVDVRVVNDRAEHLHDDPRYAGRFEIVTARAVAPLRTLVPWALPYLTPTGRLYAIKGARWQQEVDEARVALDDAGAEVLEAPQPGARAAEPEPLVVIIGRAG